MWSSRASVPADTHTVLSCTAGWPPVHRSLCHHDYRTRIPRPTDLCLVVWHTAAVVAAMPTPWNAGVHAYMNARPRQGRWAARWCLGLRHSRCCCCCCYGLAVGLFFYFVTFSAKHGSTLDKAYSRLSGSRYVHANAHRRPQSHFWVFAGETLSVLDYI